MLFFFTIRDVFSVQLFRILGKFFFKSIGKGVSLFYPLRIIGAKYMSIEDNVMIQFRANLSAVKIHEEDPFLLIKKGTTIGNFSHIVCSKKIIIEEDVLTADKVYISDNLHNYEDINMPIHTQPLIQKSEVIIGARTWIGENVCIIGAKIGKHCVIGANSVVTKDIPDYSVAIGSPAKLIKRYCFDTNKWRRVDSNGYFV